MHKGRENGNAAMEKVTKKNICVLKKEKQQQQHRQIERVVYYVQRREGGERKYNKTK